VDEWGKDTELRIHDHVLRLVAQGPGSSSLIGLFQENGPCRVNRDSNSTTLNPDSWNQEVNMLYIGTTVSLHHMRLF
jgi:hypothetical protein